ncbi:guanitoxin biosynthesis L-enduracididine beta-hydroxylase GntD [Actinomadura nitritigenes]|uniref:guanitoxin biosynthesis L-enduracididine beta-hydroxylase GntD n=1 Tax=Actinomadura nitritigenes TaxID=134602 RepID=UPI003D8A3587
MDRLQLEETELRTVNALVDRLTARYDRVDDPDFLLEAHLSAHELPMRIRRFLERLRREETGCCIIGGHPIDDDLIGPTPRHWNTIGHPSPALRYEITLILYTALLGDAFGWATQQNGRLVHDVLPIREHQDSQLGTGGATLLTWHTEDAFHPHRPDYVVLACLRNPYGAETLIGTMDRLGLTDEDQEVLRQERFMILPDESHRAANNSGGSDANFSSIEAMLGAPPPIAVLFGDKTEPYIRADPYFMRTKPGDAEAESSLRKLVDAMDQKLVGEVLRAGDFCFLDNYKVVHGRKPFAARFDGTDRWLKRACITRDLRKSRMGRKSSADPIIA